MGIVRMEYHLVLQWFSRQFYVAVLSLNERIVMGRIDFEGKEENGFGNHGRGGTSVWRHPFIFVAILLL